MKRKKFILLSGIGLSTIAIPTIFFQAQKSTHVLALEEPAFLSAIWDEKTMIEAGEAFRAAFPEEDDEVKLTQSLVAIAGKADDYSPIELDAQIQNDYATDQTVQLNGWILSKTEARQCALYSILHSN